MRYCTLSDLKLAIPARALIQLSNDDPSASRMNARVVKEAIRQAEERCDAYLRGRYVLPLSPVPTVIRDACVYLARHWLYARRPEGADLPEAVTSTYKNAIKLLEDVRDGKLTIGTPSGAAQPEPGEFRARARKPVFGVGLEKY